MDNITQINQREVAQLLGVAERTLEKWRRTGEGPPFISISRRCIRYRIADLRDWQDQHVRRSTAETTSERAA